MGNQIEKKTNSIKKKFGLESPQANNHIHPNDNTIGIEFECPNCGAKFGTKALQI